MSGISFELHSGDGCHCFCGWTAGLYAGKEGIYYFEKTPQQNLSDYFRAFFDARNRVVRFKVPA